MMEMQITTNPIYRINYNTNRLVYAVSCIISDTYEDTIGDFPPIIILTKIRILFILSKKIIKNEVFLHSFRMLLTKERTTGSTTRTDYRNPVIPRQTSSVALLFYTLSTLVLHFKSVKQV